jgi:hypothetical protein
VEYDGFSYFWRIVMPKIDFCFSGFCQGVKVSEATDIDGNTVDVSGWDSIELVSQLEKGELFISLGDYLYESHKNEIEIFDFEESSDLS